jgi:hypothetical protein
MASADLSRRVEKVVAGGTEQIEAAVVPNDLDD